MPTQPSDAPSQRPTWPSRYLLGAGIAAVLAVASLAAYWLLVLSERPECRAVNHAIEGILAEDPSVEKFDIEGCAPHPKYPAPHGNIANVTLNIGHGLADAIPLIERLQSVSIDAESSHGQWVQEHTLVNVSWLEGGHRF